jgi:hypothetical protein
LFRLEGLLFIVLFCSLNASVDASVHASVDVCKRITFQGLFVMEIFIKMLDMILKQVEGRTGILRCLFLSFAFFIMWPANPPLAQTQYFNYLHDVPVMRGLENLDDEAFSFDKPEGRIVTQIARTDRLDQKQVMAFYQSALPPLGWRKVRENEYRRSGERLTLSFEKHDGVLTVKFFLSPELDR